MSELVYLYDEFLKDLSRGNEFEFVYNGDKYGITYWTEGWMLTKNMKNISGYKKVI